MGTVAPQDSPAYTLVEDFTATLLGFSEAELATTLHAIYVAYDRGWRNIWLECDSMYVVQLLRATNPIIPWRFLARWHRARERL
ncbi:hypothetical protein ACS0TY_006237 [Phlomoides rotata]